MANEVLKWFLSVVASAGFIGGIGFIARESLGKVRISGEILLG